MSNGAILERIEHEGQTLALILPAGFQKDGIEFFTESDSTMQLGYMRHPGGKQIGAHIHKPVAREVQFTQEVLFVRKGRVRVDFFDADRNFLCSRELGPLDVILLIQGGHGFEALEELEMIEVKQGPYAGEHDKVRFTGKLS